MTCSHDLYSWWLLSSLSSVLKSDNSDKIMWVSKTCIFGELSNLINSMCWDRCCLNGSESVAITHPISMHVEHRGNNFKVHMTFQNETINKSKIKICLSKKYCFNCLHFLRR